MNQPIGIVLVSHSAQLAAGLRDLLTQIGSDRVPVAPAGGTADGAIGTSYDLIVAAIAEADRGAGVVVLADLGSSVLTAQTVLEDYPRPDVLLVDAPFVEGAVAAAVTSAGGADLAAVAEAARQARDVVKVASFDADPAPGPAPERAPEPATGSDLSEEASTGSTTSTTSTASITVTLPANLHARPAGRLAQEAATFTSTIHLDYNGKSINPTGVLAVMSLGAKLGGTITIRAEGEDAADAVTALAAILAEAE